MTVVKNPALVACANSGRLFWLQHRLEHLQDARTANSPKTSSIGVLSSHAARSRARVESRPATGSTTLKG